MRSHSCPYALAALHGPERCYNLLVDFIEDLGEAGIYGRQSADNPFISRYGSNRRAAKKVPCRQKEEQYGQRQEDELQSSVQPQGSQEHDEGKKPHIKKYAAKAGLEVAVPSPRPGIRIKATRLSQKSP